VTKLAEEERQRRLKENTKVGSLATTSMLVMQGKFACPQPQVPQLDNTFTSAAASISKKKSPRRRSKSISTAGGKGGKAHGAAALRKMCREKERRQKLNRKFDLLVSLLQLPSSTRCGKVNVLQTTMRYLNTLREVLDS